MHVNAVIVSMRLFYASRSSVCRMSSKDKMNVQDQSKERGISGDVELSEEKESSPGKTLTVWQFDHDYYILCKYV